MGTSPGRGGIEATSGAVCFNSPPRRRGGLRRFLAEVGVVAGLGAEHSCSAGQPLRPAGTSPGRGGIEATSGAVCFNSPPRRRGGLRRFLAEVGVVAWLTLKSCYSTQNLPVSSQAHPVYSQTLLYF